MKLLKSGSKEFNLSFVLMILATLCFCLSAQATPQLSTESTDVDQPVSTSQRQKTNATTLDLKLFFEMSDPREAARAIKEHISQQGLLIDQLSERRSQQREKKTSIREKKRVIHLLSGVELTPEEEIEIQLTEKASGLRKNKISSDEKITAIIQFYDELTIKEAIAILEADINIFEHVSEGAFLVRMPLSSIDIIDEISNIRWIGEYKTEYKYNIQSSNKMPAAFIYPLGGDKAEYRADLERLGIEIHDYDKSAKFYDVILDSSRFEEIAVLWWVKSIIKESEEQPEAMKSVSTNFEPDDSRELIMAYQNNRTGDGVLVGVRDNGVYENHPQLSGIFNGDSETGAARDHGTHVVGIVAGRSTTISGPWGETSVKGVAPDASILFMQNDWSGGEWLPFHDTYASDFKKFINNGVQISNHSYQIFDNSGNKFYGYDGNTQNFDAYCDDNDMVIVKSAGNQWNAQTITNPGTGKNVVTVGAIYYLTKDTEILGQRALYSSQGPTKDDQRLKPELMAPGGGSLNLGSDSTTLEGVVSTNSSIVDNTIIDNSYQDYEWESDDAYIRYSGTSMAAPHVTGVLAKMKEWKNDFHSELMKALLINTTIPIKENSSDALSGYANNEVGYGMVNAFSVINSYSEESQRLLFGTGWVTEEDLEDEWNIEVPSGTDKLVVTLAYNDEEGENSNANALKDDLDLILIDPDGNEYRASEHLATGVNSQSPLEKMVIVNPLRGDWTGRIEFVDSPGFWWPIYAEQRYGIVAHAILKTPALSVSVNQSTINVSPNQEFTIRPTIENTGGYIAAGITVKVIGDSSFSGINQSRYVGNLMYQGDSVSPEITLTAPSGVSGIFPITIQVDGINKEFSYGYPKEFKIDVIVDPLTLKFDGEIGCVDKDAVLFFSDLETTLVDNNGIYSVDGSGTGIYYSGGKVYFNISGEYNSFVNTLDLSIQTFNSNGVNFRTDKAEGHWTETGFYDSDCELVYDYSAGCDAWFKMTLSD